MKYSIYIIILWVIISYPVKSEEADSVYEETAVEKVLDKFYNLPPKLINNVTLEAVYGISGLSFPNSTFTGEFTPAYNAEIRYGFTRFYDVGKLEDRFYYAGEFAGLSNISSHLKLWKAIPPGITTDTWRFALGYRNGYGYDLTKDNFLILYHSGSLMWSITDFEEALADSNNQKILSRMDQETKFGQSFESGILYRMFSIVCLNVAYEQSLIYPRHKFLEWLGPSLAELVIQRTIDFFGDDMLEINRDNWPYLNLIIKTGISFLFTELRKSDFIWPTGKNKPLDFNSIKMGFTFIF